MKESRNGTGASELVDSRRPEWTQDESIEYEVARESITALISFRSQWLFDEEAKPSPDQAAIERWRGESAALAAELHGLHVGDRERIARICREYGPEIKRLDALELRRTAPAVEPHQ